MAYFMTFLLVPIMNVFEQRPLNFRGKSCCPPKEHAKREEAPDSAFISCFDLFTICKQPHSIALLGTLGLFFGVLIFLFTLVGGEMAAFLDDPVIKDNMVQPGKDYDQFLNDSDIIIIAPPICEWTCEWPEECDCPTHSTLPDKNLAAPAPAAERREGCGDLNQDGIATADLPMLLTACVYPSPNSAPPNARPDARSRLHQTRWAGP